MKNRKLNKHQLIKKQLMVSRSGDMVEYDILFHLKKAWDDFLILKSTHPIHQRLFIDGIHACQQVIMWRELQRLKPKKYPVYE